MVGWGEKKELIAEDGDRAEEGMTRGKTGEKRRGRGDPHCCANRGTENKGD